VAAPCNWLPYSQCEARFAVRGTVVVVVVVVVDDDDDDDDTAMYVAKSLV